MKEEIKYLKTYQFRKDFSLCRKQLLLKCGKNTESENPKVAKKSTACDSKKSKFIKSKKLVDY